jgi:hypothetical protein
MTSHIYVHPPELKSSFIIQGNLTVDGSIACRHNGGNVFTNSTTLTNSTAISCGSVSEVEKLKERVKELEEKVEELSTLMDTLLYAPPNSGGCFYEEAKASFETIFEERKTK